MKTWKKLREDNTLLPLQGLNKDRFARGTMSKRLCCDKWFSV